MQQVLVQKKQWTKYLRENRKKFPDLNNNKRETLDRTKFPPTYFLLCFKSETKIIWPVSSKQRNWKKITILVLLVKFKYQSRNRRAEIFILSFIIFFKTKIHFPTFKYISTICCCSNCQKFRSNQNLAGLRFRSPFFRNSSSLVKVCLPNTWSFSCSIERLLKNSNFWKC
jgi:hypothetical protein